MIKANPNHLSAHKLRYSADSIPDLSGRCFVVTGANSGIGAATTRLLAHHGAQVVMACRSNAQASALAEDLKREDPAAAIDVVQLDLAYQESISAAVKEIVARFPHVDGLLNNAGIYRPAGQAPFVVNHLGHFSLSVQLINHLAPHREVPLRVVTMTSLAHKWGSSRWGDGQSTQLGYAASKRANLLFALELARRCEASQLPVVSLACHPGAAVTRLAAEVAPVLFRFARPVINRLLNSPMEAALPGIRALTESEARVRDGNFYTPAGALQLINSAVCRKLVYTQAQRQVADSLWRISAHNTGVDLELR